jgi:hypothetical protein
MSSDGPFKPHPPSESRSGRPSARALLSQITAKEPPEVPSVWSEIQTERRKIVEAPSERASEQQKTDLSVRVKTVVDSPKKPGDATAPSGPDVPPTEYDDDFDTLMEIRSKIEILLDEQETRSSENEANLGELRLVLENMNMNFELPDEMDRSDVDESAKYVSEVQSGQSRLQESIRFLVKGAAQLFMQKNRLKIDKLRSDIADITYLTAQVDEQIRIKNALLEERLNSSSKIDATNANLRRRIESMKNEIRAIAGQDFEEIPELARNYQETMKRIIAEEVELTKQLWAVQQELEKERKEQVQITMMFQKVKDHPLRMAQLREELEAKVSVLRNELFEKERLASQQRGQLAANYQNETQRLIIQARKEREEQLFNLKTAQIHQLILAEKQSREEKMLMISTANAPLAANRQFKQKIAQFDRESKALVDSYEQTVHRMKAEFAQAERRMKREHDAKIQAAMEEGQLEKTALENEVAQLESVLAAKDAQYQQSSKKLEALQTQLAQLKEKIAKFTVSNQQLEKAIGTNSMESDELMNLLRENKRGKVEEKNAVKRKLLDVITSLSYFMVLSGEKEGDWMEAAQLCYQEALDECESEAPQVRKIPIPFAVQRKAVNVANGQPQKKERRGSFS